MDSIMAQEFEDGAELVAVGIVAVVNNGEETFTRTFFSDTKFYAQLGILHAGLDCVTNGERLEEDE
jgi:hypothetical protein